MVVRATAEPNCLCHTQTLRRVCAVTATTDRNIHADRTRTPCVRKETYLLYNLLTMQPQCTVEARTADSVRDRWTTCAPSLPVTLTHHQSNGTGCTLSCRVRRHRMQDCIPPRICPTPQPPSLIPHPSSIIHASSQLDLGSISARSRLDLGSISARSRLDLGSISARSQ